MITQPLLGSEQLCPAAAVGLPPRAGVCWLCFSFSPRGWRPCKEPVGSFWGRRCASPQCNTQAAEDPLIPTAQQSAKEVRGDLALERAAWELAAEGRLDSGSQRSGAGGPESQTDTPRCCLSYTGLGPAGKQRSWRALWLCCVSDPWTRLLQGLGRDRLGSLVLRAIGPRVPAPFYFHQP